MAVSMLIRELSQAVPAADLRISFLGLLCREFVFGIIYNTNISLLSICKIFILDLDGITINPINEFAIRKNPFNEFLLEYDTIKFFVFEYTLKSATIIQYTIKGRFMSR